LTVASNGGLPILHEWFAEAGFVETNPVEVCAAGIVKRVFLASGHNPKFAAEIVSDRTLMHELADFRGSFGFLELGYVFNNPRLANDGLQLDETVQAWRLQVEIYEYYLSSTLNQKCGGVSECQGTANATFV
jgi:hypothetical protein